jgi:hypothetical protein
MDFVYYVWKGWQRCKQEQIKHECKNLFIEIISFDKEKDLMYEALNNPLADYIKMFLIAEYKEKVYESMFSPYFKKMDEDVLNELERIIHSMYTYEDIYNYQHVPLHFLFADKFYSFFEYIESKGVNLLDPHNDTEVYDDEPCDSVIYCKLIWNYYVQHI